MAMGKLGARGGFGTLGALGRAGVSGPSFPAGIASTLGNVNQVMNPLMIGLAAGTPGTLPDFWTADFTDVSKGVTSQIIGPVTVAGNPGIRIRFSGTPTAGAAGRMQIVFQHFVEGGSIARANAVTLAIAAGSLTNCAVNTFVNCADTANSYLTTLGFAARSVTGSATKFPFTYTTDPATGFVDAAMSVSYTVGSAFDITLDIALPQDERGATTHDLLISTPVTDGFYSRAIPTTFFGSHVEAPGLGGEPFPFTNGPFTVLSRGKSYNPECRWNDITNPSSGVYDFTGLDAWVLLMQNAGMTPVFTTFTGDSKPTWVSGTATNPGITERQTWLTALINRYKTKIAIWEGINEVDGGVFWTGTKQAAVDYQQFLYAAAKAANPSCIVLGPSTTGSVTSMGYMRDLLALGLGSYCDVFNYHSYNQSLSFTPELNLAVNMAHLVMYRRFYGGTAKPVWDSEGSFAHPPAINAANQMDFLMKQGFLALSGGSEHTIWYATDNSFYGTLWDATNGYNDAATALKVFRAWTNGATPVGPVTLSGTVWTMDFTRAGGYFGRVMWDTAAASTVTVPSGYTQFRDAYGNRYTVNTGDTVGLTDVPILLESTNTLGQIITGYILTPAQNNKTVWDTLRDGALPPGNGTTYTATVIANGTAFSTYSTEAQAVFTAMTTPPSTARKTLINNLIVSLKNDGVWSKLSAFQIYAAADTQAAALDWANLSRTVTLTATPTFTADRGYLTNGTTSWIDTGVNPTTAVGANGTTAAMTMNSNTFGGWSLTSTVVNQWIGQNTATPRHAMASRATGDVFSWKISTTVAATVANTDGSGWYGVSRTASTGAGSSQGYKNGAQVNVAGNTSSAPVSANLSVGLSTATTFVAISCSAFFAGSGMTTTDHANLYTRLRAYMTGVGVP